MGSDGTVTVTQYDGNGTLVLALEGDHDITTIAALEQKMSDVSTRCTLAVIDLTDATFIDSTVIHWLLRTHGSPAATGHSTHRSRPAEQCHGARVRAPGLARRAHLLSHTSGRPRPDLPRRRRRTVDDRRGSVTRQGHGHRATASHAVTGAFERIGAQAWRLALWIVNDERVAEDILVAVFTQPRAHTQDDSSLVYEVRRRALQAATVLTDSGGVGALAPTDDGLPIVVKALPERERAAIELALLGKLDATAIARTTNVPRADVIALLSKSMRKLTPVISVSGRQEAPRYRPSFLRRVGQQLPQSQSRLER